ncbi:MAG: TIGR03545 family protein [Gracilimonas sp.]|uniref:TIGR03545 family protein n=1 Tax=Gracilimonas TaxID=649462 RepID=UPI001B0214E4|nr:TIGR03545 family protein [Gracilimonas sp.]MBO6585224.1 TIGR03545 family protein [Gracilimonas sp.]MBO6615504.1 TIGR03545 family protein [Gracilimonas sp.]
MRIGGIITVLVLAGIGFAATYFITEEWVEGQIEYQGSILNEAKVELDGFDFSLWDLHIKWSRLQVANSNNTMQNTFETGETEFSMEFWPLILRNKVIVDNVRLTGFQMDTERETDGSFEIPEEVKNEEPGFVYSVVSQVTSEAKKNAEVKFTDVRDDLNVDSLMAKVNIQSVDKIDSLRQGIQQKYAKWDSTFKNTKVNEEVAKVRSTVESINPKEIKNPKQVVEAIENVQKLRKQVDSLKTRAEKLKKDFEQDYGTTRNDIDQVDNWIRDDYQRALSVAKLPDLDVQNIGKALFGQNLLGDYAAYLEYVAIAREYGSRLVGEEDSVQEIPRYEGLDYEFSDKYDYPGFWFKNIELSGKTKSDISISGTVTDISSSQKKTGQPVKFNVQGQDENEVALTVNGEFNYLEEEPRESFRVNYSGFTLSKARLSGSDLLPYELKTGTGELNVEMSIIDKRIDSRIDYLAKNISFDFAAAGKPKNRVESLIRNAIGSTDQVDVTALVDNVDGPLRVRVRSNVDDLFMNALKQTVSQEVENAKRKIRAEVQKEVAGKKQQLEKLKAEKEAELRKRYEELQAKVDEQLQVVEEKKKELEERKKELEDSLKDKIKDKIGIDF